MVLLLLSSSEFRDPMLLFFAPSVMACLTYLQGWEMFRSYDLSPPLVTCQALQSAAAAPVPLAVIAAASAIVYRDAFAVYVDLIRFALVIRLFPIRASWRARAYD